MTTHNNRAARRMNAAVARVAFMGDTRDAPSAVRRAGWCPRCKERIKECECEGRRRTPLEFEQNERLRRFVP